MAPDLEPTVTLPWLVRLRWLFFVGQLVVLPVARWVFGVTLAWWLFAAALAIAAISNIGLATWLRRARWAPAHVMGGVLVLDTALLTVQLAALGGATNPFTVFYLVYITLSAVVLSARWTTLVAGLAIAGFATLFLIPAETHVHHSGPPLLDAHLRGMWAAFVLAALLTAFFVRRISRAIASQREQIATLRETAARNARLASLATLAAGAAHELNNPLSTIAVAAHEATLRVGRPAEAPRVAEDLALILDEVDRCQAILHQLSARATQPDVVEPVSIEALLERVRDQLGDERARRIDVQVTAAARAPVELPPAQVVQSMTALIRNALDASGPADRVTVAVERAAGAVSIAVEDRGTGISEDVLGKVGEPFFTTKQPGRGMGLGVFLARVFFESRGGALSIESTLGVGTRALARLPVAEAR